MKITCTHGYFRFEERKAGEVSDFVSVFGLELVRKHDYFTFADLEDAPEFSIKGADYMGNVALHTFAGNPWEVFETNGLVFDYDQGLVKPIASITQLVLVQQAGRVYVSDGLILPGSLTDTGERISGYVGWFNGGRMRFTYSEVQLAE